MSSVLSVSTVSTAEKPPGVKRSSRRKVSVSVDVSAAAAVTIAAEVVAPESNELLKGLEVTEAADVAYAAHVTAPTEDQNPAPDASPGDEFHLSAPPEGGTDAAVSPGKGRRLSEIVRMHDFTVPFPDGTEGACRYQRLGPSWHAFDYRYADQTALPRQFLSRPMGNDIASIEEIGNEMAAQCFRDACRQESKEYFARASEAPWLRRTKRPEKFKLAPNRARELGGRYALCLMIGKTPIPAGYGTFETVEEANVVWWSRHEKGEQNLLVFCCNRLDRCWELPRFNPLYAEVDPRQSYPDLVPPAPPKPAVYQSSYQPSYPSSYQSSTSDRGWNDEDDEEDGEDNGRDEDDEDADDTGAVDFEEGEDE